MTSRHHLQAITAVCMMVLLVAGLIGCSGTDSADEGAHAAVPPSQPEIDAPVLEGTSAAPSEDNAIATPLVDIPTGTFIIELETTNFDLERNVEQVLAVKNKSEVDSPIHIMVAAYDNVLESYKIVFEQDIKAVNARAFSLAIIDIVGDHNWEIICRGMDAEGRQTLDVFHRTTAPAGFGLFYKDIFSVALKGSIEIQELERSGAYQVGQANGVSFPIITQTQDEESENLLDLVQRTYYWHFSEDRYIEGNIEKIPGEEIEQKQLSDLFRKNVQAFTEFLNGNWFLTDESVGDTLNPIILNFDIPNETFTYYTGELQEAYKWISTYKFLMRRVEISGDNEFVPFMKKQFHIEIVSLDTIQIRGTDPWKGTYKRLSSHITNSLSVTPKDSTEFPELNGHYYSAAGNELFFEGNSFRLVEGGIALVGGFALYDAGVPVLELRILDGAGLVADSRRFRFDFTEERRDDRVFRTLYLIGGVIGIYGFEATADTYIRFEQIIAADQESQQ